MCSFFFFSRAITIWDHFLPLFKTYLSKTISCSRSHFPFDLFGSKWFSQRSLHCLAFLKYFSSVAIKNSFAMLLHSNSPLSFFSLNNLFQLQDDFFQYLVLFFSPGGIFGIFFDKAENLELQQVNVLEREHSFHVLVVFIFLRYLKMYQLRNFKGILVQVANCTPNKQPSLVLKPRPVCWHSILVPKFNSSYTWEEWNCKFSWPLRE